MAADLAVDRYVVDRCVIKPSSPGSALSLTAGG